jgi:hypothetical protein
LLETRFTVPVRNHIVEIENGPFRERLLVDGAEVDRNTGLRFSSNLHAAIADGDSAAALQARLCTSYWPLGIRCTLAVDGTEVYRGVKGAGAFGGMMAVAVATGWLLYLVLHSGFVEGFRAGFRDGFAGR